mgnify:CR=1 FL=1
MKAKDVTALIDRIVAWVAEWTSKLRELYLGVNDSRGANRVWLCLVELEQIYQPLDDLCFWLKLNRPELFDLVQLKVNEVKAKMSETKKAVWAVIQNKVPQSLTTLSPAIYDKTVPPVIADLNNAFVNLVNHTLWDTKQELLKPPTGGGDDEAYISHTKAIELSGGILTRKKLDTAIEQGKPIKVRSRKPRINRRNVHIQDVLLLIKKLSGNEKASEEAIRMFAEYKKMLQKRTSKQVNLD